VDDDVAVGLLAQESLDRVVGAVGIANQDREAFLDHCVNPAQNLQGGGHGRRKSPCRSR
jgi:hypothetical protein